MKKVLRSFFLVLGVMALAGFIQACSDDANANGGTYTKAEVDALVEGAINELREEMATTAKPRDTLYSSATSATSNSKFRKVASKTGAAWADIGTRLECLPANGLYADWCRVLTPQGYYMGLKVNTNVTYARHAFDVHFTLPDCQGNAYVRAGGTTPGFVTAIKAAGESAPSGVYMVAKDATPEAGVSVQSILDEGGVGVCRNEPMNTYDAYRLVENDPDVTGALNTDYGLVTHTP